MQHYILDANKVPVPATMEDMVEYFKEPEKRRVAQDTVNGCNVSTVFLCIDHRFGGEGPPILFETMIFGPPFGGENEYQERYCTWEEAVAGHARAIAVAWNGKKSGSLEKT